MSTEKNIIRERQKAGALIQKEAENLEKEYAAIKKTLTSILMTIERHEEKFFGVNLSRITVLASVFSSITQAIHECETKKQLGKKSEVYKTLAEDLEDLEQRLRVYKKHLSNPIIDSKATAIRVFKSSVSTPFEHVTKDFQVRIDADRKLAQELKR
jgi:hypothetical protein